MIKISTLTRKLNALNLEYSIDTLTSGFKRLRVSLEDVSKGTAKRITWATEDALFKYLRRYDLTYDFNASYTAVLIGLSKDGEL